MKPALVMAGFGVAEETARQNSLEALASAMSEAHPDHDFFQAYTSAFLRKRLQKKGIFIPSPEECLEELAQKGYERVLVQPTHLTSGEEYRNKLLGAAEKFRERFSLLLTGEPLFFREEDYLLVLDALQNIYSSKEGELVLLGHGSPHQHNPVYERLQMLADARELPMHIGVVEESDTPDFSMVLERLRQRGRKKILLAPLLLSGGVHVTEDMAGDSPASWKSRLEAEGFSVSTALKGLGEYPEIRALYLRKADRLVRNAN